MEEIYIIFTTVIILNLKKPVVVGGMNAFRIFEIWN